MPGVTITATSPALISPSVAVTESDGSYRLVNLPPGTYALQAELPGFSTFRREGVLLRAAPTSRSTSPWRSARCRKPSR